MFRVLSPRSVLTVAVLLVAVILISLAPQQAIAAARPNIVLIMADDMGISDIGCYGGEIDTPNLDKLAAGGLRFTHFYNTARCCPTRATLLTGLYAHQASVGHMMGDYGVRGYRGDLNDRCVTIAEALGRGGYRTIMTGKWHVTRQVGLWSGDKKLTSQHNWPRQRGFDRFYGTIHGAGSFYDPISLTRENTPVKPEGEDYYYTTAIAENACGYLDEAAKQDAPFFLYVPFTSPHWPLHAPEKAIAKYRGKYDGGWDQLRRSRHKRMIELGVVDSKWALTARDRGVPAWEDAKNKKWQARRMEVYAAQIDVMDQAIGQIVAKIKQLDRWENTLVLFLADNGGCAEEIAGRWGGLHIPRKTLDGRPVAVGNNPKVMPGAETNYQSYGRPWANASNTPYRLYKHWVHEGGIASPLIAHWPAGIKRNGKLTAEPGHVVDIMATCLDVAGVDYPKTFKDKPITPLAGVSLAPAFTGRHVEREAIYWEHEGNRAVRTGKWKLVSRFPGKWELYDLEADRTELNDLAAKHPDRVRKMAALYDTWAARSEVLPWRSWVKKKPKK